MRRSETLVERRIYAAARDFVVRQRTARMNLIILHYHLRPGGVRRVIELAVPSLVRYWPSPIDRIMLAVGEEPDLKWKTHFQRQMPKLAVQFFIEPAFGYISEQNSPPSQIQQQIKMALNRLLNDAPPANTLIWIHNPAVGRNLLLTRELTSLCTARGLPLMMHHHDWWFDNRWHSWEELKRCGLRTLKSVAETIFPEGPCASHFAINQADSTRLENRFARKAGWLPNLVTRDALPAKTAVRNASTWLHRTIGTAAPVWILPCRFLRRKNIAEALLLTRWLRPDGWLVTTGGVSSAGEKSYFEKIAAAAKRHAWPFRPALLAGDETNKPGIAELLAASEAVLLTSIQEGFGLPYLEAAAAERPLIARSLPNIAPDLAQFGFKFSQSYDDILIEPGLFDWDSERKRQTRLFNTWRRQLPRSVRNFANRPALLANDGRPHPVPFSRLTFTAQLEVLAQSVDISWARCAPLNPFLTDWRKRAANGNLRTSSWPRGADRWLSPKAYAQRFHQLAAAKASSQRPRVRRSAATALQDEFLRAALHTDHLFPLLWAADS